MAAIHIAKEAFGRVAFALTRAQWASEIISEARMERRFAAMARVHVAKGGSVITTRRAGATSMSLEA